MDELKTFDIIGSVPLYYQLRMAQTVSTSISYCHCVGIAAVGVAGGITGLDNNGGGGNTATYTANFFDSTINLNAFIHSSLTNMNNTAASTATMQTMSSFRTAGWSSANWKIAVGDDATNNGA